MNHALTVRVVERARHGGGDPHRIIDGQLLLAIEATSKTFPFDEWHHVEQQVVGNTRIEERKQIRVLKVGRYLNFREESINTHNGAEVRLQDLERDLSVVAHIAREVH